MSDALGARYGYASPVDQLLSLGDLREQPRYDYLSLGLRPEDVPALIRLAGDAALWQADGDETEVWAPVHAWRALGELRAEEAIGPLVALLSKSDREDYDDWLDEELPDVFAQLGPAAVQPLAVYLRAPGHSRWARVTAATSLGRIAKAVPETRDMVVTALRDLLEDNVGRKRPPSDEEETLNGFVISELITLQATETAPTIARAFAGDRVDESIAGDLEDVQIALGLRTQRDTPARNYFLDSFGPTVDAPFVVGDELPDDEPESPDSFVDLPPLPPPGSAIRRVTVERKAKSKRKMAQQSRKQNRKKK